MSGNRGTRGTSDGRTLEKSGNEERDKEYKNPSLKQII
jgi:hypothetical protein